MILRWVVDSEEQNWFKRAHMEKFLGLSQIEKLLVGLDKCEIRVRKDFDPTYTTATGWSGPKDQQNKADKFLSVFGVMYVIVKSQKDKGKALKEHILKDIVPRGFDTKIEEVQGKHQEAITGCDNQIKALEFRNEEHQQKILRFNEEIDNLVKNRHVARRGSFDNVLCFIKKNSGEVHPYYVIRYQYRRLEKHK